jgi:hypothetical protein
VILHPLDRDALRQKPLAWQLRELDPHSRIFPLVDKAMAQELGA